MKIVRDLKSIVKPAQVFALIPFYNMDQEESFKLETGGKIYGYLVAFLLMVSSIMFCEDVLFVSWAYKLTTSKSPAIQGDTEEINRTIETLFCICSYTMIVLSSVHNGGKHCRTLREIAKIDEYLEVNGFKRQYSCRILGTLLAISSAGVVVVAFYYVHYLSEMDTERQCVVMFVYSLQLLYSYLFAIYLRIILMNLAQRIEFLNCRLDEFTRRQEKFPTYDKENWRELSNLIEMFCKFRYITENMNSVTGVSLLFFFGFSFYTVTNQSYLAFATLTSLRSTASMSNVKDTMGLSCAWVIAETATMIIICSSCDALASEANNTSQILSRVYGKSKEFQNIIDKYLTKSINQDVQFTAYGFFAIDNSTLFKIFSAVTTYLVILIQFKQLEDSKLEDTIETSAAKN
ncbi:gustatory receptor 68a [Drosophila tropicalis]|uniref:gustatory receptor 68a n=1 Tax=Drosophila tropicalis TaxID=46794 RepID=UPI0035ABD3ED